MSDIETTDQSTQADIELPNGVTLTGIGGDVDAIREQLEERHDEIQPPAKETAAVAAQPAAAEQPAKKTRGQKRFDELTAERESEKRRADALQSEVEQLRAKVPAVAPAAAQPAAAVQPVAAKAPEFTRPEPTEEEVGTKYQTYSAFVKDLAAWTVEQERAKLFADLDARSTQRIEEDRTTRTISDKASAALKRGPEVYSDFDAVLKSADGVIIPRPYQEAILRFANPEHIMYALAKDHAKLKSILSITDGIQLGIELAQLMPREPIAPPASIAPVVRTTNAPAPIQPVGAGTRTTSPTLQELAETDFDAYKAARAAGQTH